jgi:hypothetical protein
VSVGRAAAAGGGGPRARRADSPRTAAAGTTCRRRSRRSAAAAEGGEGERARLRFGVPHCEDGRGRRDHGHGARGALRLIRKSAVGGAACLEQVIILVGSHSGRSHSAAEGLRAAAVGGSGQHGSQRSGEERNSGKAGLPRRQRRRTKAAPGARSRLISLPPVTGAPRPPLALGPRDRRSRGAALGASTAPCAGALNCPLRGAPSRAGLAERCRLATGPRRRRDRRPRRRPPPGRRRRRAPPPGPPPRRPARQNTERPRRQSGSCRA